ncbi:hypothetical protein EV424DRAFT_1353731 [Suillus variegatus]|nr:hypothetical protein EV424DRAFT_1353731 [Suillus variegatus]
MSNATPAAIPKLAIASMPVRGMSSVVSKGLPFCQNYLDDWDLDSVVQNKVLQRSSLNSSKGFLNPGLALNHFAWSWGMGTLAPSGPMYRPRPYKHKSANKYDLKQS